MYVYIFKYSHIGSKRKEIGLRTLKKRKISKATSLTVTLPSKAPSFYFSVYA